MKKNIVFAAVLIISLIFPVMPSVPCSAEEDGIDFDFTADGTELEVYIKNYDESSSYQVSISGGKSFIPMYETDSIRFYKLPAGTYQICVQKNNDRSTLTGIKAASLGEDTGNISLSVEGIRETGYKSGGIRVEIENYSPRKKYLVSVNGGKVWRQAEGRVTERRGLYAGDYTVVVKELDKPENISAPLDITVPVMNYSDKAFIKTSVIKQAPELPTGCEVTSLTMALHFYNIKIQKTVLSDFFLEKGEYRASDYRKVFVGDPRDINAYGCFAGVIVSCAENFFSTVSSRSFDVLDLTGCEPDRLYSYADMGYPVIVWATGKMGEVKEGPNWTDPETGKSVSWPGNEHCMLLVGYDVQLERVYVNDPQQGLVYYPMGLFEKRFAEMEKQAVVIVETTEK
ncbi:MAG: C39 family peptidase [Ruminococcus sp.]|nr:C39 family peptidase [Ruminococcus sp.]